MLGPTIVLALGPSRVHSQHTWSATPALTFPNLDNEGTLGNGIPSKSDLDHVRARVHWFVHTSIHLVSFVFHEQLHAVLPLGVFHFNTNVTHAGTYDRANIP